MFELHYCSKNKWWKVFTHGAPITSDVLHALKKSGFHAYVDGHMCTHAIICLDSENVVVDVEEKEVVISSCFADFK